MNKKKIIEFFVRTKSFLNWGNELTNMITTPIKEAVIVAGTGGMLVMIIERAIGKELPIVQMILILFALIIINKFIDYWVGYKMFKIGFKEREQSFLTNDTNPHLRKLSNDIEEIKKYVKKNI